jgi:DNA mismatch repair protein MutS
VSFHSILWMEKEIQSETMSQPDFFPDLNLDQVVEAIIASKQEYNLSTVFWTPLRNAETIRYRQEVMRDLEDEVLMAHIKKFAEKIRTVRCYLSLVEKLDFDYHRKGWLLEAALVYSEAITELAHDLEQASLRSRGLLAFREWMNCYIQSQTFRSFVTEAQQVKQALSELKYSIIIESGKFKVKRYEGEIDYSIEVEKTFEKLRQRDVESYLWKFPEGTGMSHIEAKILEFVARLYPEAFAALNHFCANHAYFINELIQSFDREVHFYISYLDFIAELKRRGLPFCYPEVSSMDKEIFVRDGFDIALAHALRHSETSLILNDFSLKGPERLIVVTGPNQGGKTTFARMFGQLHYFSSLGCPVPAREARLFLFDKIFTHFEKKEDISNLRGKLEDDLVRIHNMVSHATPNSLFILNEIFTSATLEDAVLLSREIMDRLMSLDIMGVWVTFLDELATLSEKTVSMVATVDPHDPTIRTFKIVRKPPDGLAYTLSLTKKYQLTYEQIKKRVH